MSAMKMHYSTATPPSFPVPRNLFFSNLDEVRRPSTPHNGHYAHASPRPAEVIGFTVLCNYYVTIYPPLHCVLINTSVYIFETL